MTKILEFQLQHQSFQRVFRVDFPWDWLVWSPCSPRDSQESPPEAQFKGINSLTLCLLYGPVLTTLSDHWEDHSLDYTDLCRQSNVSAFQHIVLDCHHIPDRKQSPSDFMGAVTIHDNFRPKKRKSVITSTISPSICHQVKLLNAMILVFFFLNI